MRNDHHNVGIPQVCFMLIPHKNTITRRYLPNLASSSVKYAFFADIQSIFDKISRKHALAGTVRDRTWWTMRCSQIHAPDLIHHAASCSDLKFWKIIHIKTTWLDERTSKHLTPGNVVQSYQINIVHLTIRHHRDLTSTKTSIEWKVINQIFMERDHRTYLCNDYCVMCISDSGSGWCS